MTRELFGTDGIRGRALQWPLDAPTLRRFGSALVQWIGGDDRQPRFLMGGDTRGSTNTLAGWIAEGVHGAGGTVTWGGVLPTPAVSILLRDGDFDAGIVISASHNPPEDNGVKVLYASGSKTSEATEVELEAAIRRTETRPGPPLPPVQKGLLDRYREQLLGTLPTSRPLDGLHIVLDAANGAASGLADEVLIRLGATVTSIASRPDGTNINAGVGAAAPEALAAKVVELGADGGLALDGDADRSILVDETGSILDGDDQILAWALDLDRRNRLPNKRVVATIMSNEGLHQALATNGIELVRCSVGDRAVWETMSRTGAALGGEQSGHIICSHLAVTGDGLLTGTQLLTQAARSGRPLSRLSPLCRLPQILINVPVGERRPFEDIEAVRKLHRDIERQLEGCGRVLLRYSGTEKLARVMLEGEDESAIRAHAEELAEAIRHALPTHAP